MQAHNHFRRARVGGGSGNSMGALLLAERFLLQLVGQQCRVHVGVVGRQRCWLLWLLRLLVSILLLLLSLVVVCY